MIFLNQFYQKFRCLILYGIIGCFSAGLDFIIFTAFVSVLGWNYIISNCISVLAGIITSFMLNRNYNFRVKDRPKQRFGMFLLVGICGMILSNTILWICIDEMGIEEVFAKLLSIVLVVFFQFLLNKYVTFKPTKEPSNYL